MVRWIDSSHCHLLFENAELSRQFLNTNVKRDKFRPAALDQETGIVRDWVELEGYTNTIYYRPIFARSMTSADEEYITTHKADGTSHALYASALKGIQK